MLAHDYIQIGGDLVSKGEIKMKKIVIAMAFIFISLTGCGANASAKQEVVEDCKNEQTDSMFVVVEKTNKWSVVYHKDTKVMYVVPKSYNGTGIFTVLMDASGAPLLYEKPTEGGDEK